MFKIFLRFLRDNIKAIIGILFIYFINIFILFLYSIELDCILYMGIITLSLFSIGLLIGFYKYYNRHKSLLNIEKALEINRLESIQNKTLIEEDYFNILKNEHRDFKEHILKKELLENELNDYFTLWVHQIKTPISALSLILQASDFEKKEATKQELFKIEKYVEMVLGYLRIGSISEDLILKEVKIEDIINSVIKKYAIIFIYKKIRLKKESIEGSVITDEKWIGFALEQIISNSLKYTDYNGEIEFTFKDKCLSISDTGIGIPKEDIPRVFEKGFTGFNGRMNKKSTGLGLFLCKRVLDRLNNNITINSNIGEGTKINIYFNMEKIKYD